MAEPRKVQLSTESSAVSPHPPAPKQPRIENQESETPGATTVRIVLSLFEPDQKRCPEFFYPELLKNLGVIGKSNPPGEEALKKPLNPCDAKDAEKKEVEDLAQRFQEKYGKKRKKQRRDRVQDLVDMGYGYDESDSFIDNSEAYDELVPASLNTKHGGFYINSGTLQFRQASDSEGESVRDQKKPPKKIKEQGDKLKKKKREDEKKSKKKKYPKPGFTALNGMKDKKKKKHSVSLSEMLAKFQKEKEAEKKSVTATPVLKTASVPPVPPSLPPVPPREAVSPLDPLPSTTVSETKPLQAATAKGSLSERDPENLLEHPQEKARGKSVEAAPEDEFKKPPPVPDGLPPPIEKRIKELTKLVRQSEGDKKAILFTQEMNTALLDIYLLSRDLSSELRAAAFTHLSSVLPCNKDTLVKWASCLCLHKQGGRLREPLQKLKEAIAKAMPEQINKYHERKAHNETKYAKTLTEDKEQKLSEEEEEEDKGSKKAAGPRKKFQWSDEIRQLLCQLVKTKVEMYEQEGSGVPSLEDYFKSFLDVEVKSLWPRGWMQARTLFKESRHLYPQLISIMAKNKGTTLSKVKVKEPSGKNDRIVCQSPADVQAVMVTASVQCKDSPVTPSIISPSRDLPTSVYTQDNSLDGDLIHNPPSLDAVSEHLTALSGRTSGVSFDFPVPKSSGPEKTSVVEEKKKPSPPANATTLQPSPRPIFLDQSLMGPEKKLPTSKQSSDVQQKQKPIQQNQTGTIRFSSPSLQPSVKLFQINNQQSKGNFIHSNQSGGPKVPVLSPQLRPMMQQTKSSKPHGISPPASSPSNHKPIVSQSFVGKHHPNASSNGPQMYRSPAPRLPIPPHGNSTNTGGPNPAASLSPSPPSLPRNVSTPPAKKPAHPPQKLTLMAPQDSGVGTQGVAKLLTSSMVAGVMGNSASPANLSSQKCSVSPGLLPSSQSLALLTSSYKTNGGKIPTATLGLLSPIHTFPLHVISYAADPATVPGPSKDAVVTGPAPGTFNHGLPQNLLGGLHTNVSHLSTPIPHPALPGHIQPAQTGGAHVHMKGPTPPQRKL